MKRILKPGNLVFILILGFVLYQQIPVFKNNREKTNNTIVPRKMFLLNENSPPVIFPPHEARAIVVFWASWCGPCKLEMNRLKSSVESGAIPKKAIFAINPFETDSASKKFVTENNYPFNFLRASSLAQDLGVTATPITIFLDNGVITSMTSGMSLWGIWKAELYFSGRF